jgi:hypothetical protein
MTQPQHLFIPADAGEKVTLPGIAITIKVTAASTGNAFAVFEEVTSPGAGPALHVHRHQFEIFRFLEGTYEVKVGDAFFTPSRERLRSSRQAIPMPSATSVRVRLGCSTSLCLAQAATSFSDNSLVCCVTASRTWPRLTDSGNNLTPSLWGHH